jgi:RNA recognition motif-containing protein
MAKLFVGNLPFSATEDEVRDAFARIGTVQSVTLPTDRDSGRPRGFAFVEMDDDAVDRAISELDGTDFGGRTMRVDRARERERGGGGRGGW